MLPPLHIRYQFDPSGDNVANSVAGEIHQLPQGKRRIIVPRNGAFYAQSLRVIYNNHTLTAGRDYEVGGFYQDATNETGQAVNVLIYFINPDIIGEVSLFYQVVGGKFTGTFEAIEKYVNALLVDPRKVHWDDILNKPHFYVPKEHFHDINDVYGLNPLIYKLEEIRQVLTRMRSEEFRSVYSKMAVMRGELKQLIDVTRGALEKQIKNIGDNEDSLNGVRAKLEALIGRVTELEQHAKLEEEIAKLRAADELAASKLVALEQSKVSVDNLNTLIDELKQTYQAQFQSIETNKANKTDLNTLKSSVENILSDNPDNLLTYELNATGERTGKILYQRPPRRETTLYVNSQAGVDTNDGSSPAKALRSLAAIKNKLIPNANIIVILQGNNPHVIIGNDTAWILQSSQLTIKGDEGNQSQLTIQPGAKLDSWLIGHASDITLDNVSINLTQITQPYSLFKGSNNYTFTKRVTFNTGENNELTIIDCQHPRQVILDEASLTHQAVPRLIQGSGKLLGYLKAGIKLIIHRDVNLVERYRRLPVLITPQHVAYLREYIPSLRKSYINFAHGIDSNLDPSLFDLLPNEADLGEKVKALETQVNGIASSSGVGFNSNINTAEAFKGVGTAAFAGVFSRQERNNLKISIPHDSQRDNDYNGLSVRSQDGDGQHTSMVFLGPGNSWLIYKDGQYENEYVSEQFITSTNLGDYVGPHLSNHLRLEQGNLITGPYNLNGEVYRYYIDPVHGNDAKDRGDKANPLRSVDYCLTQVVKTGTIAEVYLKAGHIHTLSKLSTPLDVHQLTFNIYGEQSVAIKAENQPEGLTVTELRDAEALGTKLLCAKATETGAIFPASVNHFHLRFYNLVVEMQTPNGSSVVQSLLHPASKVYCLLTNCKLKLSAQTAFINNRQFGDYHCYLNSVEGYDILEGDGKFIVGQVHLDLIVNQALVNWFTKERIEKYLPANVKENGRWHDLFRTNLPLPNEWKKLNKDAIPISATAGNQLVKQADGLYVRLPEATNQGGGASSEELTRLQQLIEQLTSKVQALEEDNRNKALELRNLETKLVTANAEIVATKAEYNTFKLTAQNEIDALKLKDAQYANSIDSISSKQQQLENALASKVSTSELNPVKQKAEEALTKASEATNGLSGLGAQITSADQRITALKREVDANTNFRNSLTFEYVDEPASD